MNFNTIIILSQYFCKYVFLHHTLSSLSVTYTAHYVLEDLVTLAKCSSVISGVPIRVPHRCPQTRISAAITVWQPPALSFLHWLPQVLVCGP